MRSKANKDSKSPTDVTLAFILGVVIPIWVQRNTSKTRSMHWEAYDCLFTQNSRLLTFLNKIFVEPNLYSIKFSFEKFTGKSRLNHLFTSLINPGSYSKKQSQSWIVTNCWCQIYRRKFYLKSSFSFDLNTTTFLHWSIRLF